MAISEWGKCSTEQTIGIAVMMPQRHRVTQFSANEMLGSEQRRRQD